MFLLSISPSLMMVRLAQAGGDVPPPKVRIIPSIVVSPSGRGCSVFPMWHSPDREGKPKRAGMFRKSPKSIAGKPKWAGMFLMSRLLM